MQVSALARPEWPPDAARYCSSQCVRLAGRYGTFKAPASRASSSRRQTDAEAARLARARRDRRRRRRAAARSAAPARARARRPCSRRRRRWNGVNTWSRSASGMPAPPSATSSDGAARPARATATATGGAPWRRALSSRLRISRRSSRGVAADRRPARRRACSRRSARIPRPRAPSRSTSSVVQRRRGVEPARQQDLVDQAVELGDVARRARP